MRRGLSLVLVVGVLGVMSVLAVCFVTLAQLERKAGRQRTDTTRAILLARSGLEDALARISAGQGSTPYPLRGISGLLHPGAGRAYVLKVEDESGKINVNGGLPGRPLEAGWNAQLQRILNLLGSQPDVNVTDLGNAILSARPPEGYRSILQLQALLGISRDLSPWLTARSWSDVKVVHPNPETPTTWRSMSDLKMGRTALALEEGGRPPVNLNTAPRSVLVALAQDLAGYYFKPHQVGATPPRYALSASTAAEVVDQILRRRQATPFRDWADFSAFLDGLVPASIQGMNPDVYGAGNLCGADLLKANFDPNTQLNKDLPDQLLWRWIDKSDLSVWSTEGCFSPTGFFRISCVGRLTDAADRLLASAELVVDVEAFRLLRQTTQRDFVAGRTLTPPAGEPRYLSLASTMTDPSLQGYGATALEAWWGGNSRPEGLAVMTYPCPIPALPSNAADFDGALGLATVEMRDPSDGTLKFLHHFDDSWDADRGAPSARREIGASGADAKLQADLRTSTWPDPPGEPNTLRPDGLHQQWLRSPCFQARGNIPGVQLTDPVPSTHGAVGVWLKPLYTAGASYDMTFSCIRKEEARTQALGMGTFVGDRLFCGLVAESWATDQDMEYEAQAWTQWDMGLPLRLPEARWQFHACAWDTNVPFGSQELMHQMRDWREGVVGPYATPFPTPYPPLELTHNQDLVPDDAITFVLGGGHPDSELEESREDAVGRGLHATVLDEFALMDFGDEDALRLSAFQDATAWAATRWRSGRYYKEGDGAFTSAALSPAGGGRLRLLQASWTQYLPHEARMEMRHFPGADSAPPAQGEPRMLDPRLPVTAARLELELLDASGTSVLQPLGPGSPIDRTLSTFRYRVNFKVRPVDPSTGLVDVLNQPVLETPFLDDITFAWQPASGPRLLAWCE